MAKAPPPALRGPAPASLTATAAPSLLAVPPLGALCRWAGAGAAAAAAAREGEGVINNPRGGAAWAVQTVTRDVPEERGAARRPCCPQPRLGQP